MSSAQQDFRSLVEEGIGYVPAGQDDPRLLRVIRNLVEIHNRALEKNPDIEVNMGYHCVNDVVRTADIFRALMIGVQEMGKTRKRPRYLEAGAGTSFFTGVMMSLGNVEVKAAEQDEKSLVLGRTFLDFLGFQPDLIELRDLLEDPVTKGEFTPNILFSEQICGDTGDEHFHRVMQAQARDRETLTIPYAVQPVLGVQYQKWTKGKWSPESMIPAVSEGTWMILEKAKDPHLRIGARNINCPPSKCVDLSMGLNVRWIRIGEGVSRSLVENMANGLEGRSCEGSLCVPNTLRWNRDTER